MSGKLVLVTGVNGFIAAHVANYFLEAGYRVRGTARGEKAQKLTNTVHVSGLEFIQVDDLVTSDLTEALKGVYAVIHVASPLPERADAEETLDTAVLGTLHVLEATVKAGIEKIVITSSFAALMEPSLRPSLAGLIFTGEEWGSVTREEALKNAADPYYLYFASKVLSERAVWKFAGEHPEIDVATILPGFVYGPWAENFPFPSPVGIKENDFKTIGTNALMYRLINGVEPPVGPPVVVDVRDVAKAHLLALPLPRRPLEEKRYIAMGGLVTWKEAVEILNRRRPEIKTLKPEDTTPLPGPPSTYDTSKSEKDLGIKWIKTEDTIVDAVDSILKAQKAWAKAA